MKSFTRFETKSNEISENFVKNLIENYHRPIKLSEVLYKATGCDSKRFKKKFDKQEKRFQPHDTFQARPQAIIVLAIVIVVTFIKPCGDFVRGNLPDEDVEMIHHEERNTLQSVTPATLKHANISNTKTSKHCPVELTCPTLSQHLVGGREE
ncbi:hypothetical protein HELRODRAFT_160961 [Helobdella robusta]|uniref:Uncharacterized protein n=1 Tax=Helobdella robusta TaxID=6412 RepID=T1EQX1_HELRO|nr:hypothetical protein HELRODRAFT_160961 [Helobdella robusta]ESO01794.1 hypothetical protein HELRODRAFT_160961 [Helobdella robusta]